MRPEQTAVAQIGLATKGAQSNRAMPLSIARLESSLATANPIYSSSPLRPLPLGRAFLQAGHGEMAPAVSGAGAVAPCGTIHS